MSKTESHAAIRPLRKCAAPHIVQGAISARYATGGDIIRYLGDQDPTSLRMMQAVLAIEEEQADGLDDLQLDFAEQAEDGRGSGNAN